MGHSYIMELNSLLKLSPGKYTTEFREKKDKKKLIEVTKKKKLRQKKRFMHKKKRNMKSLSIEKDEGTCYQSGMGYLNTDDLVDEVMIPGNLLIVYFKI